MKKFIGFLLILTLLNSATITGSIYSSESFEKLNNTILKFEGNGFSYKVVSKNGSYSIELPEGEYTATVQYIENETLTLITYEKILVGEKNQTFDLVLFSPYFFENEELPNLEIEFFNLAKKENTANLKTKTDSEKSEYIVYIIIGLLIVVVFLIVKKYCKFKKTEELGADEKQVLGIIKKNEGRIEQKMLREILKYSESKMSIILTELEIMGYIKRFKKGRTNIIKLKKMI